MLKSFLSARPKLLPNRSQFADKEFLSAKLARWENAQPVLVFARFALYHLCKLKYGGLYEMASHRSDKQNRNVYRAKSQILPPT